MWLAYSLDAVKLQVNWQRRYQRYYYKDLVWLAYSLDALKRHTDWQHRYQ